jgi:cytochrome c oxidase assembly protein subunit 15
MEAQATPLPEAGGFQVSPRAFRRLALAAAAMLLLIVATGATVRLTSSGLGCRHWPGCQAGNPFPERGYHSYIEFGNRVVAFFTIVVTLASGFAAVFVARLPRWAKGLALATFGGTLAQAPLGAVTVYFDLNPWLVLTHLLLSLAILGAGVVVVLEAFALEGGHVAPLVPPWVRRVAVVTALACAALVVSGTIVTASGPHPGDAKVHRLGHFDEAIWVHVRATAAFGLSFLVVLVHLVRRRRAAGRLLHAALAVLALLLTQMAIGEVQYRTRLPWWLVLAHVTVAAAVWAALVALVVLLWRPPRFVSTLDK